MAFGIRVKISPQTATKPDGTFNVLGGQLELLSLGKPASEAARDAPKPARLLFHGAFLEDAKQVPDFTLFATLSGQLELVKSPVGAHFICDPETDFELSNPPPEGEDEDLTFRELRIAYSRRHFDAPADGGKGTRLRLPDEPEGSRFFELAVALEVNGVAEAELLENDRLDVPLDPLPGPLFEWPNDLTERLPAGVSFVLEEAGKRMSLDWEQGVVIGPKRRFSFHRLRGRDPVKLIAKSQDRELVLLDGQLINDPTAPVRWDHVLEELLAPDVEGDDLEFTEIMPELPPPA